MTYLRPYKTSSNGPVKKGYVEPEIGFTTADGSQHTFWSGLKELVWPQGARHPTTQRTPSRLSPSRSRTCPPHTHETVPHTKTMSCLKWNSAIERDSVHL